MMVLGTACPILFAAPFTENDSRLNQFEAYLNEVNQAYHIPGLALVITRLVFKGMYPEILPLLCLYTGAGCVLGHNFPFYMNFKGGKGIASTGGIMIAMHWLYVPVGLVVFFGTFFLTHYVSLGSLLLYLTFFVETVVLGELGIYGVTREILIEMYIIVFLLTVMAYWKHRGNISRLIHGNERKTYLSHKNQEKAKEENK